MNCPVCGSTRTKWLIPDIQGILGCHECRHVFRNYPLINLKEYYSKIYRSDERQKLEPKFSNEVFEKRNEFILGKISRFIQEQKALFEVGFGHGYFYNSMSKAFPDIKYSCCEISEPLAEANKLRGIDTTNCSFQDVVGKKFDIIASFDVLEHIYNPKDYVSKLDELLNVGGLSIIQVPTDRELHFRKPFDGHYHYFSDQSLKLLMGDSYECKLIYKTKRGETASGREYLTVFKRLK
jgi:SAM-dependent methyltransferase